MQAVAIDRPNNRHPVPQDAKEAILDDCRSRIPDGDSLSQIATDHGISERTLKYWLADLPDNENDKLRRAWIDNMLNEAMEAIEQADDTLPLARARERWKAVTWYVERRDRQRYGNSQQINITGAVAIDVRNLLDARLAQLQARLAQSAIVGEAKRIEADPAQDDEV